MIKIVRDMLASIVNDIDAGNSNLSESECSEVIDTLKRFTDRTQYISKYEAYTRLGVSRATFDRYVNLKMIPKGVKRSGFKELCWKLDDIEKFKSKLSE